jgi:hypothetical protein
VLEGLAATTLIQGKKSIRQVCAKSLDQTEIPGLADDIEIAVPPATEACRSGQLPLHSQSAMLWTVSTVASNGYERVAHPVGVRYGGKAWKCALLAGMPGGPCVCRLRNLRSCYTCRVFRRFHRPGRDRDLCRADDRFCSRMLAGRSDSALSAGRHLKAVRPSAYSSSSSIAASELATGPMHRRPFEARQVN